MTVHWRMKRVDPLRATPPAAHRWQREDGEGSGRARHIPAVACSGPSFKTTAGQSRAELAAHPSRTRLPAHSHPTTMGAGRGPGCSLMNMHQRLRETWSYFHHFVWECKCMCSLSMLLVEKWGWIFTKWPRLNTHRHPADPFLQVNRRRYYHQHYHSLGSDWGPLQKVATLAGSAAALPVHLIAAAILWVSESPMSKVKSSRIVYSWG